MKVLFFFVLIFSLVNSAYSRPLVNYGSVDTYSQTGYVQMIVEIPAGTNKKLEYDKNTNTFPVNLIGELERKVKFLPYPGNYGFIPSTLMDIDRGGDGDPMDILLLSSQLKTGTVIEIIPIAIIVLEDGGQRDDKVIAVPKDKNLRIIDVTNFHQFETTFGPAKNIIEQWFINYKGTNTIRFKRWGDNKTALNEISKWAAK
jgi:inorganic pyrophosphatase